MTTRDFDVAFKTSDVDSMLPRSVLTTSTLELLMSKLTSKTSLPFPFILNELAPIRPVVKQMFGFTHVYLDDKLLCSLRQSSKQPATNGMWLYTTTEHIDSLAREFPDLPRRSLWRGKGNA